MEIDYHGCLTDLEHRSKVITSILTAGRWGTSIAFKICCRDKLIGNWIVVREVDRVSLHWKGGTTLFFSFFPFFLVFLVIFFVLSVCLVGSSSLSISERNEESQTASAWSQLLSLLPQDGNDTAWKHV